MSYGEHSRISIYKLPPRLDANTSQRNAGSTFFLKGNALKRWLDSPQNTAPDLSTGEPYFADYYDVGASRKRYSNLMYIPELCGCILEPRLKPEDYSMVWGAYDDTKNVGFRYVYAPKHWRSSNYSTDRTNQSDPLNGTESPTGGQWKRKLSTTTIYENERIKSTTSSWNGWPLPPQTKKEISFLIGTSGGANGIIGLYQALGYNDPVMFGFERHTSTLIDRDNNTADKQNEFNKSPVVKVAIRRLYRMLPKSLQSIENECWLIARIFQKKVIIEYAYGDAGGYTLDKKVSRVKIGEFSTELLWTTESKTKLESFYLGLLPVGNTLVVFWIVDGKPKTYCYTMPQERDYGGDFDETDDSDAHSLSFYDDIERRFYDYYNPVYPIDMEQGYNWNTPDPSIIVKQQQSQILWEEDSDVTVNVYNAPMYVKICPMIFNMNAEVFSNFVRLGYNPEIKLPNTTWDHNPRFINEFFPNRQGVKQEVRLYSQTENVPQEIANDNRRSAEWIAKSFVFITRHLFSSIGVDDYNNSSNTLKSKSSEYMFMFSPAILDEILKGKYTFSYWTPFIGSIGIKWNPENMGSVSYDPTQPVAFLDTDIMKFRQSGNFDEVFHNISNDTIDLDIVCYDESHEFLKTGVKVLVDIGYSNSGAMTRRGIFKIKRVDKTRESGNIVFISLQLKDIMCKLEEAKIFNCEVYDGLPHFEAVSKLCTLADVNLISRDDCKSVNHFHFTQERLYESNVTLPWNIDRNEPVWRPNFGSSVKQQIDSILKFSGYHLLMNPEDGRLMYIPDPKPEEQDISCIFVENVLDLVLNYDESDPFDIYMRDTPVGKIIAEIEGFDEFIIDDQGRLYAHILWNPTQDPNVPKVKQKVPIISFKSITESQVDELVTRVMVLSLNLSNQQSDPLKIQRNNNTTVDFSNDYAGVNSAIFVNYELERELDEQIIGFYSDRRILQPQLMQTIAKNLLKYMARRRKYFSLEIDDMSSYLDVSSLDKVYVISDPSNFLTKDLMNRDPNGDVIDSIPTQEKASKPYRVVSYTLELDQMSRRGSLMLGEYIPDITLEEPVKQPDDPDEPDDPELPDPGE